MSTPRSAPRSAPLVIIAFLMLFFPAESISASGSERSEIRFIRHLVEQQFWGDALHAIEEFEHEYRHDLSRRPDLQDSLHFMAGWSAYNRMMLPDAIGRFQRIGETHPGYLQAAFYTFYLRTYQAGVQGDREHLLAAAGELASAEFSREVHAELQSFQLAGMHLLLRDFTGYESHSGLFTGSFFAMAEEQQRFRQYALELQQADRKSPFAAALMSAVVPGSGKIYAGRRGSGISSFLQVAVFGGIFAESLTRAGAGHPRTWAAGSALGLFYVSNIWGSAIAVRISQEETYEEIDQRILFDLHIPLRSVFR